MWRVAEASIPEEPGAIVSHAGMCVQIRLVCSAGVSPAGAKARSPVVWIAGGRETEILKPIDKAILGMAASHQAIA
ncbi:MAG: hypothetical protein A2Z14_19035 [Chloroflexi bacterium RBG_16_48_8]|nr:MAG: hypothetical protein A2Z14_19035 [Chloroflexi bacterium RBG_16_48_8]